MEKQIEVFVPGRLCLFGEHSDWAGQYRRINSEIEKGSCIVVGIEQGIYARVSKSKNLEVRTLLHNGEVKTFSCEMDYNKLLKIAEEGNFFSYIAGVTAYLLLHYNIEGLTIDCYKMTLPLKRGLSSSAAICVLTARAINTLSKLNLSVRGEMEVAYRGELLTPSRCGRMDQACAYGKKPINIVFDGDNINIEPIIIKKDIFLVFSDLNGSKDTKAILRDLNSCYPFHKNEMEQKVHLALGQKNLELIKDVREAFHAGDNEKIGMLMTEAQAIFDEDVSVMSAALNSPKLHKVLNDDLVKSLTYGGKGVGSQGDGAVQFIAKDEKSQIELLNYLKNNLGLSAYPMSIKKQNLIQKAIIPAAGFGTRMYPFSKIVSKPLLPVQDIDGLIKPALLILLEQLDKAGIEKIGIIVREEELNLYKSLFGSLSNEHFNKLPTAMKDYELKLLSFEKRVEFIIQNEQLGFGHAVYHSKSFSNGEPVLLLLGDYLYASLKESNCMTQLINEYDKFEQLTVGISEVKENELSSCGIVSGSWEDDSKDTLSMIVEKIAEKPTVGFANDYLTVVNKNNKSVFYAFFGQYILTPEVYTELEKMIETNKFENGEIQLTTALQKVKELYGMRAIAIDGKRFDFGNPKGYIETLQYYSGTLS